MLPYTPLHYLLLERAADFPPALVMTSGNFSEEPIATDDADALARLAPLCDAFLLHDRPIHIRCDDSVVRPMRGRIVPLRRSRGYAPYPVPLPFDAPPLLATGAEMKNTFCVARDRSAFMSQHIGELGNYDARRSFERSVEHLSRLYRVEPKIVAHDAHPDYAATRYALGGPSRKSRCSTITRTWQLPGGAPRPARRGGDRRDLRRDGLGPDGANLGRRGAIAAMMGTRAARTCATSRCPRGRGALRPYRVALAHLWAAGIAWDGDLAPMAAISEPERAILAQQLESGLTRRARRAWPPVRRGGLAGGRAARSDV